MKNHKLKNNGSFKSHNISKKDMFSPYANSMKYVTSRIQKTVTLI